MRPRRASGEALGLRWRDIDFDAGLVRVSQQLRPDGTRGRLKTEAARRDVVLNPALARELRTHKLASAYSQEDDLVFAGPSGKGRTHRRTLNAFDVAADHAGLNQGGRRKLVPHDLRHTFGSLLIAEGQDIVFVSKQLGHEDVSTTLDVYASLYGAQAHAERAREALSASMERIAESSRGKSGQEGETPEGAKAHESSLLQVGATR